MENVVHLQIPAAVMDTPISGAIQTKTWGHDHGTIPAAKVLLRSPMKHGKQGPQLSTEMMGVRLAVNPSRECWLQPKCRLTGRLLFLTSQLLEFDGCSWGRRMELQHVRT